MKHIALILPAMRMGGAEKICLNFLEYLVKEYSVTMILSKKEGDLLNQVPSCVDIVEDRLLSFNEILTYDLKKLRIKYLLKDFIYYFHIKTGCYSEKDLQYLISRTPARAEHYDCAISYVANVSTQVFSVLKRINADLKIAWIHGETTELKDTDLFAECYNQFDKIFAVSEVTKSHFIDRFPNCKNITDVYYNPISVSDILEKSQQKIDYDFNRNATNIVTVGRITPEKGMTMIPSIVEQLINDGINTCWYIVGDGTEYNIIKTDVEEKGLQEHIIMVGNQLNPYPFIKKCDIYVQPSYEEGYSTTICEAGVLGKAIVGTTTSGGIREQIDDGISGILAEPTPKSLADAIERIVNEINLKKSLEKNVANRDYSNVKEFKKLEELI